MRISFPSTERLGYPIYSPTRPGNGNEHSPGPPGVRADALGRKEAGGLLLKEDTGFSNTDQVSTLGSQATEKQLKRLGIIPCKTCQSRRYQDRSNDPGVSMKAPTYLSPAAAGVAVAAHENEHVQRERAEAQREGKEVIYQYVQFYYATCPECGRTYVAGGRTVTVTGPAKTDQEKNPGELVNIYA